MHKKARTAALSRSKKMVMHNAKSVINSTKHVNHYLNLEYFYFTFKHIYLSPIVKLKFFIHFISLFSYFFGFIWRHSLSRSAIFKIHVYGLLYIYLKNIHDKY
jgi:hypothetical protein